MPFYFHLAFLGRKVRCVGDQIEYLDDLPPPTDIELDASRAAAEAAWNAAQNPPKLWPNVESFIAEFTLEELAAISLSTNTTIAGLRLLLSAWRSEINADDPRVMLGLNALVYDGIISREKLDAILS